MNPSVHLAVLTAETMELLNPHSGGSYLDATLGGGTHTAELLRRSGPDGRVLSLDLDAEALERARDRFHAEEHRWLGIESHYRHMDVVAKENGFFPLDGILIDAGLSSDQLQDPARGFSFSVDGPLDMRFGSRSTPEGTTAAEIVNGWPKGDLEYILREYGEERYARRIAEAIVVERKRFPILHTLELADLVRAAVPRSYEHGRIHPATRAFQALRIVVNDELEGLQEALHNAWSVLGEGGRVAVISFHSLEDRVAKQEFRDRNRWLPITKKPRIASEEEVRQNPRARSAKLRVAEKITHSSQDPRQKSKNYASHLRDHDDSTA